MDLLLNKRKKGEINLENVKYFIIGFLIIGVIAVVCMIALFTVSPIADNQNVLTATVANEALTTVNNTGSPTAYGANYLYRNPTCAISNMSNATARIYNVGGNYTNTACVIYGTATMAPTALNASTWYVNYVVTYTGQGGNSVSTNISQGIGNFFSYAGTIFTVLAISVIIGVLALVIYVVYRFSGHHEEI
jgi:hypothetical protein